MGQANDKFSQLDEKYKVLITNHRMCWVTLVKPSLSQDRKLESERTPFKISKGVETERDSLRKKVKETEIKIEVQSACR